MLSAQASLQDTTNGETYLVEVTVLPPDSYLRITAKSEVQSVVYELADTTFDTGRITIFPLLKKAFEGDQSTCVCALQALSDQNCLVLTVTVTVLEIELRFVLTERTGSSRKSVELMRRIDSLEKEVSTIVKDLPQMLEVAITNAQRQLQQQQPQQTQSQAPLQQKQDQKFDYVFLTERIRQMVREELKTAASDTNSKNHTEFESIQNRLNECVTSVAVIRQEVKNNRDQIQLDPRLENIAKLEHRISQLTQEQETNRQNLNREINSLQERFNFLLDAQKSTTDKVTSLSQQSSSETGEIQTSIKQQGDRAGESSLQSIGAMASNTDRLSSEIQSLGEKLDQQTNESSQQIQALGLKSQEETEALKSLIQEVKSSSRGPIEKMVDQYHDYCSERLGKLVTLQYPEQSIPDKCVGTIEFKTSKVNSFSSFSHHYRSIRLYYCPVNHN
jgi:hypothetical protein